MMRQVFDKVFPWLWAAVWFTLPVSLKASGASLLLFGLAAVAHALLNKPVPDRWQWILAGLMVLLFAWHAVSLAFDPGSFAPWKSLERKLSLIVIPVIMLLIAGTRHDLGKWALCGFFAGLAVTGLHMLVLVLVKILAGKPPDAYTYHAFTGPYTLGAIYFSFYLSVALYCLAFLKLETFMAKYRLPLGLFFLVLMLFCASKLFILLSVPAIIQPVVKDFQVKRGLRRFILPLVTLAVLIGGSVPLFNRISELKNTDLNVVSQESYRYDTPLNGLTFRMVLWRFAGRIMQDEQVWLTGTGIGSRQQVLDRYYQNFGIYTGNPDLGDTGYLGYNFHNQYLEIMVGTGIPGLLLLLAVIIFVFKIQKRALFFPFMVYILIFIFFITESVLERQAGLVFVCLLWTLPGDQIHTPELNKKWKLHRP
jgi:O-antigen ligase